QRRIIGSDASAKPTEPREPISRTAPNTAKLTDVRRELRHDEIVLDARYPAAPNGIADDTTMEAMRLAARTEGMITEPVYEGKSMAGLIDLIDRGEIGRSENVLYAHLGGQPAINGYSALFS